jgi:flagellar motor component MotA
MDIGFLGGLMPVSAFHDSGILLAKGSSCCSGIRPRHDYHRRSDVGACSITPDVPFAGYGKVAKIAFFVPNNNPNEMIVTLVSFSEKARREGLLALEDDLDELNDEFLRKGIQLVVDGTDPEMVRHIMETEIENMIARHEAMKKMFDDLGGFGPAFGMIGTLIV